MNLLLWAMASPRRRPLLVAIGLGALTVSLAAQAPPRALTIDAISVDDFDVHELRAASYYDRPQAEGSREAA